MIFIFYIRIFLLFKHDLNKVLNVFRKKQSFLRIKLSLFLTLNFRLYKLSETIFIMCGIWGIFGSEADCHEQGN